MFHSKESVFFFVSEVASQGNLMIAEGTVYGKLFFVQAGRS